MRDSGEASLPLKCLKLAELLLCWPVCMFSHLGILVVRALPRARPCMSGQPPTHIIDCMIEPAAWNAKHRVSLYGDNSGEIAKMGHWMSSFAAPT